MSNASEYRIWNTEDNQDLGRDNKMICYVATPKLNDDTIPIKRFYTMIQEHMVVITLLITKILTLEIISHLP